MMKFVCRFCKILFVCETFEQVGGIQMTQCYITRKGITHSLQAVIESGGESNEQSN